MQIDLPDLETPLTHPYTRCETSTSGAGSFVFGCQHQQRNVHGDQGSLLLARGLTSSVGFVRAYAHVDIPKQTNTHTHTHAERQRDRGGYA